LKKEGKKDKEEYILDGSLLDATGLKTLFNAQSNAPRNSLADLVDILAGDALTKGSSDNIVAQRHKLIGDLASAKVLSRKGSDEGSGFAVRVELSVDGTLIEGSHHVGCELGADNTTLAILVEDAVLGDHLGDETAGGDDLEFSGARVDVKSVHATG
jgi:hypothetical protein